MPIQALLATIYHELTHAAKARRGGFPLNAFLLENEGHGEYFGGSGVVFGKDTQIEHAMEVYFAGPLGEVRFLGGKRKIDKAASFKSLLMANQNLFTKIYMVGLDEPIEVSRGTFSDDWNEIHALFHKAVENGAEIDVPELFSVLLDAAIDFVNDDAEWNIIDTVASQVSQLAVVEGLAAGVEIDIVQQVNEILSPHYDLVNPDAS